MSFDHWWVGLLIDERDYERFSRDFAAAADKAVLSPESRQAIEDWRQCPSGYEQEATMHGEAADRAHRFIWAFNLPGFDQLAEQFLTLGGKFAEFPMAERCFRIAMAARHTPLSIVWHALGYERAGLLPGQMGNMLLHPRDIESALKTTSIAYAGLSSQDLLDAAARYCGWYVSDDTLQEVISFLPDGLGLAKERGQGFLALARPQI